MPTASFCDFLSTGVEEEPGIAVATEVRVTQRIRMEGALRHITRVGNTVDHLCAIGARGSWEWGWGEGNISISESHRHPSILDIFEYQYILQCRASLYGIAD